MQDSPPPAKRRHYDAAFRAEALRLAEQSRSTQAAAHTLNIDPKRIYKWQKEALTPVAAARGAELDSATAAELHQLRAAPVEVHQPVAEPLPLLDAIDSRQLQPKAPLANREVNLGKTYLLHALIQRERCLGGGVGHCEGFGRMDEQLVATGVPLVTIRNPATIVEAPAANAIRKHCYRIMRRDRYPSFSSSSPSTGPFRHRSQSLRRRSGQMDSE